MALSFKNQNPQQSPQGTPFDPYRYEPSVINIPGLPTGIPQGVSLS